MTHFTSIPGTLGNWILSACALGILSAAAWGQQPGVEKLLKGSDIGPQVKVQLRVIEISQTKLKRLGFSLEKIQGNAETKPGEVHKKSEKADDLFSKSQVVKENSETNKIIESLCKDHLAKVIVNSTLAPPSGKTVVYNLDPEPAASNPKKDAPAASDRPGTQVKLKAEATDDDAVRLEITFRASRPATAQAGGDAKKTPQALQVREFEMKAELQKDQVLILAGPTQVRIEAYNEGVPVVSEIPYLGALFRNVKEERNEVQMLVVVKPEVLPPHSAAAGHHHPSDGIRK
jgi:pilus assembly protein CpaC